jgi:hypothetical protein
MVSINLPLRGDTNKYLTIKGKLKVIIIRTEM